MALRLFAFHALITGLLGSVCFPLPVTAQEAPTSAAPAQKGVKQMAEAQRRLKKISETEYELDGIRINAETRQIRIPAVVNLKKGPVEYMLVHETGKTHESVLSTQVRPTSLQVALLLVNYQAATEGLLDHVPAGEQAPIWKEINPKSVRGNRLRLEVEWKAGADTKRTAFSEWVLDVRTNKPPADLGTWIFTGSFIGENGFAAEDEGSMVGIWLDPVAILNSPAKGNWRDELWAANDKQLPDEGTPVILILTPDKQQR